MDGVCRIEEKNVFVYDRFILTTSIVFKIWFDFFVFFLYFIPGFFKKILKKRPQNRGRKMDQKRARMK